MRAYPVLAQVSLGCSEPKGTFPRVTHPSAAPYCYGARLACVKPAASVRSEPGSNSQVGLETLNRLITTFDEVPPYRSTTIHIAFDHGVSLFKTCTAEVFRPVTHSRKLKLFMPARLARTPPSTFLFLHLHLSNSPGRSPSPEPGALRRPLSTANDNRWRIGCSIHSSE